MYSIVYTNQFKKSLKRCVKRGLDVSLLTAAVTILQEKGSLPAAGVKQVLTDVKGKNPSVGSWVRPIQAELFLLGYGFFK